MNLRIKICALVSGAACIAATPFFFGGTLFADSPSNSSNQSSEEFAKAPGTARNHHRIAGQQRPGNRSHGTNANGSIASNNTDEGPSAGVSGPADSAQTSAWSGVHRRRGATGAIGPSGATVQSQRIRPHGRQGATGASGPSHPTNPSVVGQDPGPTGSNGQPPGIRPHRQQGATGGRGSSNPTGRSIWGRNNGRPGPTGARGPSGATGSVSPHGTTGSTGAHGSTGPTGSNRNTPPSQGNRNRILPVPIGPRYQSGMGMAVSFNQINSGIAQTVTGASGGTLSVVSLPFGTASTNYDLSFDSTTSQFTVNTPGTYVIGYGLSCEGSHELVNGANMSALIAVERIPGDAGTATELGAVPLAVTPWMSSRGGTGATGARLLSGYGQIQATLNAQDTIRLMVFLNNAGNENATLKISPDQISSGTDALNCGGTLSLMRMP